MVIGAIRAEEWDTVTEEETKIRVTKAAQTSLLRRVLGLIRMHAADDRRAATRAIRERNRMRFTTLIDRHIEAYIMDSLRGRPAFVTVSSGLS